MRSMHLIGSLLIAGCAALPKPGEKPVSEPVLLHAPVDVDVLWETLPIVYDSLGFEGAIADSAQRSVWVVRTVSLWTPWIGPSGAPHVRCTVPHLMAPLLAAARRRRLDQVPVRIPPAHVTLTVSTNLAQVDSVTRVETRVSAVPTGSGPGDRNTYCVSTGRLEARIAELLQERLSGSPRAPAGPP
jgi:hypothetical protein